MKSSELETLIRSARPLEDPSAEDRARVQRGVLARIAAGAPGPDLGAQSAAGRSGKSIAAGAALGGVALTALMLSFRSGGSAAPEHHPPTREAAPAQQTAPTRAAATQEPATRAAAPTPVTAPSSRTLHAAPAETPPAETPRPRATAPKATEPATPTPAGAQRAARATPTTSSLNLAAESRALAEVQAALRDGQPERALALLAAMDHNFKAGLLREERAAAQAMAWCENGDTNRGRSAAAEFRTKHPNSPLTLRVMRACKLE